MPDHFRQHHLLRHLLLRMMRGPRLVVADGPSGRADLPGVIGQRSRGTGVPGWASTHCQVTDRGRPTSSAETHTTGDQQVAAGVGPSSAASSASPSSSSSPSPTSRDDGVADGSDAESAKVHGRDRTVPLSGPDAAPPDPADPTEPDDPDAAAAAASAAATAFPTADDADHEDLAILNRLRADDADVQRAAMADLITRYQHRIFGLCLRMIGDRDRAADLAQDAFVQILTGIHAFDGRSRLGTWMYRITMNVCLAHLRKEHRRQTIAPGSTRAVGRGHGGGGEGGGGGGTAGTGTVSASPGSTSGAGDPESAASREPGPTSRIETTEGSQRVEAAIMSLDVTARAILVLRDVRGLEYDAIADVLEIPLGTVKSRLYRARTALRDRLSEP